VAGDGAGFRPPDHLDVGVPGVGGVLAVDQGRGTLGDVEDRAPVAREDRVAVRDYAELRRRAGTVDRPRRVLVDGVGPRRHARGERRSGEHETQARTVTHTPHHAFLLGCAASPPEAGCGGVGSSGDRYDSGPTAVKKKDPAAWRRDAPSGGGSLAA